MTASRPGTSLCLGRSSCKAREVMSVKWLCDISLLTASLQLLVARRAGTSPFTDEEAMAQRGSVLARSPTAAASQGQRSDHRASVLPTAPGAAARALTRPPSVTRPTSVLSMWLLMKVPFFVPLGLRHFPGGGLQFPCMWPGKLRSGTCRPRAWNWIGGLEPKGEGTA